MCVCVCLFVCVCVCVYICIYIYIFIYKYMYASLVLSRVSGVSFVSSFCPRNPCLTTHISSSRTLFLTLSLPFNFEFQVQIVLSHTPPTYIINHIILLPPPPLCFLSRMRSCSWTKPNTVRFTRSESSRCGAHSLLLKLEKTRKKRKES